MRRPTAPNSTSRPVRAGQRTSRRAAILAVAGLVVTLVLGAVAPPAMGDAIDDRRAAAEKEKKANERKRSDAEEVLEGLEGELGAVSDRLLEIETQLPAARLALQEAEAEFAKAKREAAIVAARLEDAKDQAADLSATIEADSDEATKMREAIGQMAREAYRGGGDVSSVSMILDADSSEDFIERADLMSQALRTRAQVLDDLQATESGNRNSAQRLEAVQGRISELKDEADAKVAASKKAKKAAEDAKAALDALLVEQQDKQTALLAKKDEIAAKLKEIDAEAKRIEQDLAKAIAEQRKRDAAKGTDPDDPPAASGTLFVNPTQTRPIYVTSEYGMRFHPVLHYWRLHAGIDLRDYCGNDVYAGRSGTVLWTQYRYGYGNQVMISHGTVNGKTLASSYNHLSQFLVRPGASVKAGQLIARAGNTGTSGACHLHFEVYMNSSTVNPRPFLPL
ncbi:peptidoglycan DD-metalloendopeptidase family protein [Cellulomonas persica]|uniref:Metalloendopeptidase n=1 Tax=Cellulomonas persica TaxID=76861 RepID=A0A510UPW9_9CELL|nr:peptidoglycan DD-metalloendopeptidase family protein [Cellulomonas persica]GEK16516.1 metalloendopeptidase [Cellulomonas persica]